MKSMFLTALTVAFVAQAPALHAQTTAPSATPGQATTPQTTPSEPPAATAPAPAAPTSFTDQELRSFAFAAIEADKIMKDATIPQADKQSKMLAAVQAQGLEPAKYNAIAQAAQTDPELVKKIQAAAAAAPAAGTQDNAAATPGAASNGTSGG